MNKIENPFSCLFKHEIKSNRNNENKKRRNENKKFKKNFQVNSEKKNAHSTHIDRESIFEQSSSISGFVAIYSFVFCS